LQNISFNYNALVCRNIHQEQSSTEALIQHLETKGIKHNILKRRESRRLKGLFIACPESIQHLQSHHDVVLIDNTHSTNRFGVLLMDIIGVDHNKKSFILLLRSFLTNQGLHMNGL
jgi:hypothetical protein